MKRIIDLFKENATNISFYVETENDKYFDFCSKYKRKTGASILFNKNINRHNGISSKWRMSAKIIFSSNNQKFIEKLQQHGYNVKSQGKKYTIYNVKLFWKLIDNGYRI